MPNNKSSNLVSIRAKAVYTLLNPNDRKSMTLYLKLMNMTVKQFSDFTFNYKKAQQ